MKATITDYLIMPYLYFHYLKCHPPDVMSRYRDPQVQVGGNYSYLFNLRPNICKCLCLNTHYHSQYYWFGRPIEPIQNEYNRNWWFTASRVTFSTRSYSDMLLFVSLFFHNDWTENIIRMTNLLNTIFFLILIIFQILSGSNRLLD